MKITLLYFESEAKEVAFKYSDQAILAVKTQSICPMRSERELLPFDPPPSTPKPNLWVSFRSFDLRQIF